jgi:hypothetical protein
MAVAAGGRRVYDDHNHIITYLSSAKLKVMDKFRQLTRKQLLIFATIIGFVLGVVSFISYRVAAYKSHEEVHYHADFALYIDGQRDEFKSFTFYEEVEACGLHGEDDTKGRAHMHGQVNHIVHVHANAVTWGHFFANLGYTLGDKVVSNDDGVYADEQGGKKLSFILNGEETDNIANVVMKNEDVLLISYGDEDKQTIKKRFEDMPRGAKEANESTDPGACGASEEITLGDRFKKAFGIE